MKNTVKVKFTEIKNLEFLSRVLSEMVFKVTLNEDKTVSIEAYGRESVLRTAGETFTFDARELEIVL